MLRVPLLVHYPSEHGHILPSAVRPWLSFRLGSVVHIHIFSPRKRLPVTLSEIESEDTMNVFPFLFAFRLWEETRQHLPPIPSLCAHPFVAMFVVQSVIVLHPFLAVNSASLEIETSLDAFRHQDWDLFALRWHSKTSLLNKMASR
jgi:hypothetical protein